MRLLLAFLLTSSTMLFAQSPQSSPPLTETEKRLILQQLFELRSCRSEVLAYADFVKRETEQDARERDLAARALELEKQATALAQRETALQKERADLYESLYKTITKKPGIGCRILKIFTFGLARCQ